MRRFGLVLLVGGLLLPAAVLRAAEPQPPAERLKALISQLGSERFQDRQEASRLLEQAGEPALPLLRALLTTSDLEVRRRAEDLIPRIEVRLETARAIAPSRVNFKCQDLTVAEAITEFVKQTGHQVLPVGDLSKMAERRITLDTGDTTFWDAFAQLCAKAGIRESENQPDQPVNANQVYFRGGNGRMVARRVFLNNAMYYPQQRMLADSTLTVEDGASPHYGSTTSGSLRIRALPAKGSVFTDLPDGTKQVALNMEVKPEAHLEWTQFIALRIDRVLDDAGRKTRHTGDFIDNGFNPNMYNDAMMWQMQMGDIYSEQPTNTNLHQIPISIIVGDKSVRSLRELSGTICGRVRTAPEALAIVDNLPKAVGKTSKGSDDTEVKITEYKLDADGLYQVKVELKTPLTAQMNDAQMMNNLGILLPRGNQVNQPNIPLNKDDPNSVPFKVLNAAGETMELVTGNLQILANNESSRVFTLVYKPKSVGSEPAKLEYIGRREILVEVPFTLKDVPLVGKDR